MLGFLFGWMIGGADGRARRNARTVATPVPAATRVATTGQRRRASRMEQRRQFWAIMLVFVTLYVIVKVVYDALGGT